MLVTTNNYWQCVLFQRPHKASGEEMTKYHSDDYIKFLRSIRPDNMSEYSKQMQRCECAVFFSLILGFSFCSGVLKTVFLFLTVNVGEDCPVFDGLFEFCQLSTGGSVGMFSKHTSHNLSPFVYKEQLIRRNLKRRVDAKMTCFRQGQLRGPE